MKNNLYHYLSEESLEITLFEGSKDINLNLVKFLIDNNFISKNICEQRAFLSITIDEYNYDSMEYIYLFKNLKHLRIHIRATNYIIPLDNLKYLINLKTLHLSQPNDEIDIINFGFLQHLVNLEELSLYKCYLDLNYTKNLKNLRNLKLQRTHIYNFNKINHLQNLQFLDLLANNIGETSIYDYEPLLDLKYLKNINDNKMAYHLRYYEYSINKDTYKKFMSLLNKLVRSKKIKNLKNEL